MAQELLIDTQPLVLRLTESTDHPGRITFKGEFGRTDKPTANKRFYSEKIMKREVGRIAEDMKQRRVLGELDHPADGRTRLQRVSHLITSLDFNGPLVVGEAEVLDTPNGRILSSLAKAGVQVGVSSRGYGTTKARGDGIDEVGEDFRLDTYDFVYQPADETAYPTMYAEEKETVKSLEDGTMELTIEVLKKEYPGLVEVIETEAKKGALQEAQQSDEIRRVIDDAVAEAEQRTERKLKERFSSEVRRNVEHLHDDAVALARSEALSDPSVAAAKQVVEQIATIIAPFGLQADAKAMLSAKDDTIKMLEAQIATRDLEIKKVQREVDEARALAKEAAYKLHLVRKLRDESTRDAIIGLVGDVTKFENIDALNAQIVTVREELMASKREHEVTAGEKDEFTARVEALESRVQSLTQIAESKDATIAEANDRARRAIEAAEALAVKAYADGIVSSHPRGAEMQKALSEATNIEQVDAIVEAVEARRQESRTPDSDEQERIRRRVASGKERSLEEDTHGRKKIAETPSSNNGGPVGFKSLGIDKGSWNKIIGGKDGVRR